MNFIIKIIHSINNYSTIRNSVKSGYTTYINKLVNHADTWIVLNRLCSNISPPPYDFISRQHCSMKKTTLKVVTSYHNHRCVYCRSTWNLPHTIISWAWICRWLSTSFLLTETPTLTQMSTSMAVFDDYPFLTKK